MTNSPHSESKTEGIRIYAAAEYMPQEVLPAEFRGVTQLPNAGLQQAQGDGQDPLQSFVFRYKITMSNEGDLPARCPQQRPHKEVRSRQPMPGP